MRDEYQETFQKGNRCQWNFIFSTMDHYKFYFKRILVCENISGILKKQQWLFLTNGIDDFEKTEQINGNLWRTSKL